MRLSVLPVARLAVALRQGASAGDGRVHEFGSQSAAQVRRLLQEHWTPAGGALPEGAPLDEEIITTIIRVTGDNFRLLIGQV